MKTNKVASKKFRVTGSGKVKRANSGMSHNTGKKSSKFNRKLGGKTFVAKSMEKNAKSLLGLI